MRNKIDDPTHMHEFDTQTRHSPPNKQHPPHPHTNTRHSHSHDTNDTSAATSPLRSPDNAAPGGPEFHSSGC